ncbi:MAG: PEP-CTERM sorting domain-containing protein [Verrucomicrobia bacterium]|nr:PEP-CTERM sorting domain-containing protein [Verrucomicrobiota bacterium]
MKPLSKLLLLGCAAQLSALAQGVTQFRIDFPDAPPPPAIGIPSGSAELSANSFHAWFFLGTSAASSGRILEMADDNSLTPIFEFAGVLVDSHPPTPGIPGSGGTFYSYDQTWQVTDSQIQSVLSGRWYAEIAFGLDVHFAQLTPVPEPSALVMLIVGIGAFAAQRHRSLRK